MTLVLGTNCGFVTAAPTEDPGGSAVGQDTASRTLRHVAPSGVAKITKIGWWCDTATPDVNFELGLYSHNSGSNVPETRLYVANTNAKGTTAGWKTAIVDWDIVEGTTYWLGIQLDNTTPNTSIDFVASTGNYVSIMLGQTSLVTPWVSTSVDERLLAVYAVVSAGETIDISGTIDGTSSLSGTLIISTIIDVSGTVSGISVLLGTLTFETIILLSGTIASASVISGELMLSSDWQIGSEIPTKRLIQIGNNALWYEDI